jgi:uncharacterized membrane protein
VIAVLGGLGAAACWAAATLCASRSTKLIGPPSVLAWVMLIGFVVVAPLTVVSGLPDGLGREEVGWLAIAGAGNVGGLLVAYAALRVGKVSIVSPISSAEGAIAAVLAIATGETVGGTVGLMLVVIAVGVVLASIAPGGASGDPLRASLLASAAAICFGASLYATGRVSEPSATSASGSSASVSARAAVICLANPAPSHMLDVPSRAAVPCRASARSSASRPSPWGRGTASPSARCSHRSSPHSRRSVRTSSSANVSLACNSPV